MFQRSHRLAPGADVSGIRRRRRFNRFNEAIDWLPAQTILIHFYGLSRIGFNEAIDWLPAQTSMSRAMRPSTMVSTKPSIGSRRRQNYRGAQRFPSLSFNEAIDWLPAQTKNYDPDKFFGPRFNEAIDWLPAQTPPTSPCRTSSRGFNEAIDWLPAQTKITDL